ncbi:MFS transporter [Nocardia alni]|uniref:MFS transporter n=1 Tax=Nocardia alni TaxID=2815723 RepID=UPI001C23F122|nr:MFS transporter [Nocardia alni]
MASRRSLGREFDWLWRAYMVSAYGSGFGLGAFPLIAVIILHAGPTAVAALSSAGAAVGAVLAVPLGPWIDGRRKRPVMMSMDIVRFGALLTIPIAYALGLLTFAQLLVVAILTAAAKIAFNAASGAFLKTIVRQEDLLIANGKFEATMWTSVVVGPPLGGAAIGILGPVTTVTADGMSYLLSALNLFAIRTPETRPASARPGLRATDLLDGWRHILAHPALRRLLSNSILVNGLIMAGEPLIAILMLGHLGFRPWQYGLAFGLPCVGGLIGARSAPRLVERFGRDRVLLVSGVVRTFWILGLAFVRPGVAGLAIVLVAQFGLVTCCGIYGPVLSTFRLEQTPTERVARMLSSWSVSTSLGIATLTLLCGVLADFIGPRAVLAVAGVAVLGTSLLLPRQLSATPAPDLEPSRD